MIPNRRAIRAVVAALAVVGGGCAPALRTPAPIPSESTAAAAADAPDAERLWARRDTASARRAAEAFEARLAAGTDPFESTLGATRAWIWAARHDPDADRRREASARAVRAAQWCEAARPDAPECDYWLAAALGVQAEQRRSTALDALPRIVALFEAAADAIPDYDRGGPDRALALLFARAPGFPVGPGDPDAALDRARAAVGRFPDHAPNQAALGEALEGVDRENEAVAAWTRAAELAGRAAHAGDPDAAEWQRDAAEALARLGAAR